MVLPSYCSWEPEVEKQECEDCPVGSFSESPGSTSCHCEAGWYKGTFDEERVVWGQDECSSHGETCANPDNCYCFVTFTMPMTACGECPANTFSTAGATACQDCALGTFSEAATGCGCFQCKPGTYRETVTFHCYAILINSVDPVDHLIGLPGATPPSPPSLHHLRAFSLLVPIREPLHHLPTMTVLMH